MAKILTFKNYEITGEFSKYNNSLLIYPFLYVLQTDGKLYRLNVITHESELYSSLNLDNAFSTLYDGHVTIQNVTSVTTVGGNYLYFIGYGHVSRWSYQWHLCRVNITSLTFDDLFAFTSYDPSGWGYTLYSLRVRVIDNGSDITVYRSHFARHGAASSNDTYRNYYSVISYDPSTFTVRTTYISGYERLTSSTFPELPYIVTNPTIIRESDRYLLVYGGQKACYSQTLFQASSGVGFVTYNTMPSQNTALNGQNYQNIGLFELNNKYYAIGGSLEGEANKDLIQIDPTSLSSTKIGESPNNSTGCPIIQTTEDAAYIIYSDNLITVATLEEYDIDYTFKDNSGNVLAELTNKLPVDNITLGIDGNVASVTLRYIDSTTETVTFTVPEKPDFTFRGFSDVPNSTRPQINEGSNTVGIYSDATFYPAYVQYYIPTTKFDLNLYQNTAEANRVDKSSYLTAVGTLSGVLRDECSVLNPTITIEYTQVPNFNYVYIPIFGRYYFVDNIVSVRKNIWRLSLRCDVLMTYRTGIDGLSAVIARQEFDYNPELVDNLLPVEKEMDVSVVEIASTAFATDAEGADVYNLSLVVVGP